MKILVTGATGMAGSEFIRQAIEDKNIVHITALVRRPPEISDPKISTVIQHDLLIYDAVNDE